MTERTRTTTFADDTRGVSEVVGYALLAGLVLVSVTLTFTVGFGQLQDQQNDEYMLNMQRGFSVMSENIEDLHRDGAPGRSTELKYKGGQMNINNGVVFKVNVTHPDTGRTNTHLMVTTPIEYSKGDTTIAYTSGALIRDDNGNLRMVEHPPFEFEDDRVMLSVVSTQVTGNTTGMGGTGSFRIETRQRSSVIQDVAHPDGGTNPTLEIAVTGERYEVWGTYFEEQGLTKVSEDAANNTVTYEYTAEHIFVRETLADVFLHR